MPFPDQAPYPSPLSPEVQGTIQNALQRCAIGRDICRRAQACGLDYSQWDAVLANHEQKLSNVLNEFFGRRKG